MGKKNKFDKIERNETYYRAYGEDEGQEKKKEKVKKKSFLDIDTENVPEKKELSSKFTYKKEKKTPEPEQNGETEEIQTEKPEIGVFVLTLIVMCLTFAMDCLISSDLFKSLSGSKLILSETAMYVCAYAVPSLIFMIVSYKKMKLHYVRRFSPSLIPFSAACLGLVFSVTALQKYFIAYTFSYSEPVVDTSLGIMASILVGAVLPAVCEELFVHGILQREISEYAGGLCGIVVSSLVFAMLHFELQYFPVYFTASLMMGALTHITHSVLPAMLVHFLNNALSILFSEKLTFIATERIGGTLLMIVMAAVCFGFLILCLNMAEKISEKRAHRLSRRDDSSEDGDEEAYAKDSEIELVYFLSREGKTFRRFVNIIKSPPMLVSFAVFIMVIFIGII